MSIDDGWHLDKRVPISIIFVLVAQVLGGLWYVSELRRDIDMLKKDAAIAVDRDQRQDKFIAESMTLLRADIQELKAKIDRLVERGNGNGR
jgi:hypothetical protein